MASTCGKYGYRTITTILRNTGWGQVATSKIAHIWREEGLKIPQK
jgi:hypothetical protein